MGKHELIDGDGARRLACAVLLAAVHEAQLGNTGAWLWLTESPQAAQWLEWLDLDPDRPPDLTQRARVWGRRKDENGGHPD